MGGAWLTPDNPPGEIRCFTIYAPSGLECEASLRGALLALTDSRNWEKVGEQTPEVMAHAFWEGFYASLAQWGGCNPMGHIIGEIFIMAGETVPEGCLPCDGGEYPQETYPALFNVIGNTYGSASSGYFRVPDLSARFPIATGQISGGTLRELGDSGGNEEIPILAANLPEHTHTIAASSQSVASGIGPNMTYIRPTGSMNTGSAGFSTPINIMPPYLALNFVIQAE